MVLGTGTGIGKTFVTSALASALAVMTGARIAAIKPILTGEEEAGGDDASILSAASNVPVPRPRYWFREPVSPHLAARHAGEVIDLAEVGRWVESVDADWLLVETAGGVFSPVAPGVTNLDLAAHLRPDLTLLIARDGLGVLHDVSACLLALRSADVGLPLPWVVLNAVQQDPSTGTNAAELRDHVLPGLRFNVPVLSLQGDSTAELARRLSAAV